MGRTLPPKLSFFLSICYFDSQEALFFQRSLGFVRLAIEMGRPLLPCYSFGENQLFKSWGGHGLRLWVARKLRIGLPFFQGRWGLPLCPLPRPTDVTFVVGRQVGAGPQHSHPLMHNPLTLSPSPDLEQVPVGPANPRPSEAEVEAVFERYLEEIERLFAANAPKYLPPDVAARGLKIHRIGHGVVRHARL